MRTHPRRFAPIFIALAIAGCTCTAAFAADRSGASGATLRIAPSSDKARVGMRALPLRTSMTGAKEVWVSDDALLTEADLADASAAADCQIGPERHGAAVNLSFSPSGAARMEAWSRKNVGAMLAVVVDGRVLANANVMSPLGGKFGLCLPDASLAEAQSIAAELHGTGR